MEIDNRSYLHGNHAASKDENHDGHRRLAAAVLESACHAVWEPKGWQGLPDAPMEDQSLEVQQAVLFLCVDGLRHAPDPWFWHELAGLDVLAEMEPADLVARLLQKRTRKRTRGSFNYNADCKRWRSSRQLPSYQERKSL